MLAAADDCMRWRCTVCMCVRARVIVLQQSFCIAPGLGMSIAMLQHMTASVSVCVCVIVLQQSGRFALRPDWACR